MWVFTTDGFFSTIQFGRRIAVRARSKAHLEAFRRRHRIRAKIRRWALADYEWRMFVARKTWARALYDEANDINYVNFKNAVKDDDRGVYPPKLLNDVWATVKDALEGRKLNSIF